MKLICSKNLLNDAISMAQKAIATRSTLPILDGLLFEAEGDTLIITGYDLETGIECKIDTDVISPGKVVLNAKMIGDIVRKLPEEIINIEVETNFIIKITSGKAQFKIKGIEAADYPKIPIVEEAEKMQVSQRVLKDMINQTIFAASSDENRPILNGIKVVADNNKLELIAIDGFRLAIRREKFKEELPAMSFIVPAKAMQEVSGILDPTDNPVKIYPSHNHILFDTGSVKLVSRLLQGEYMDYNKVVPSEVMSQVKLKTKDMLSAIDRASLVINVEQRRFPVTVENSDKETLVISSQTDLGEVHEEIPINLEGENIDADYNPKYFLDALRNIPVEMIYLEFSGTFGPCLIKPLEGEQFLYLVLPLRR
ncbi:MAG: DNA polymerase III subunit beta [Clostridiaceae bacterium]|nr:DNA polymerase III subunit beta [Clostridiaceae bacterium]